MKGIEASIAIKRTVLAAIWLALVCWSSPARADEIALWNFNDTTPFIVDRGVGTLTTTADPAYVFNSSSPGGTTLNARMGDPAGKALAIFNGHNNINDGSILELRASTVGFNDIRLSWAWYRTEWGFNYAQMMYSIDGITFIDVGNRVPLSYEYSIAQIVFSPSLGVANNPNFAVRWVLHGGVGDLGGAMYFDNIVLDGASPVPEPGTILLLGSGLIGIGVKMRRLRKRSSSVV